MKRAIVIGSYAGSPWIQDCLNSLPRDIPAIVVCELGYECGKLRWVVQNTTLDEFLFLPDTVIVKQDGWIRELFSTEGPASVNAEPGIFGSFMGKYRTCVLRDIGIPVTPDKFEAVNAESIFGVRYAASESMPVPVLFPELKASDKFEIRHGRNNAVLENDHLIKFKGAFCAGSMWDCEQRDRELRT